MMRVVPRSVVLLIHSVLVGTCPTVVARQGEATTAQAEPAHAADPRGLLREAVEVLSTRALGREKVDWPALEAELSRGLEGRVSLDAGREAVVAAVARLGDRHARVVLPEPPAPAPTQPPASTEADGRDSSAQKPAQKPAAAEPAPARRVPSVPEGRLLDDGVAYVVIPSCFASGDDELRAFARELDGVIARLAEGKPKGWIVDLRLNGGGNMWPMLLGLRPLLGDGPRMTMVDGGRVLSRFGLSRDSAWIDWGNGPETQLAWGEIGPRVADTLGGRVGVLVGSWTMSSGEATAICLAGSDGSLLFGEPTAGLTTVTNTFPLSDGSTLILPVSEMGDVSGATVRGAIAPARAVAAGDWPSDDDATARAARAWVLEAESKKH